VSWEGLFRNLALARHRAANKPFGADQTGLLAPGAPPPPPNFLGDVFDYRGAAPLGDVSNLQRQPIPVGRVVDLDRQEPATPIGFPFVLLQRHVAIIGPTGSGKTVGLVVPWIDAALRAGYAVVAGDVKGNLREALARYVQRRGKIGVPMRRWDYRDPGRSRSWHWISELTDERAVDGALTALFGEQDREAKIDPFFKRRDYRALRGLLKFAPSIRSPNTLTVADLLALLKDQDAVARLVDRHPRAPGATDLDLAATMDAHDYERAISGAREVLTLLNTSAFIQATSRVDLRLDEVIDGPGLLLVGSPTDEDPLGQAAAGLMFNSIAHRLYRRYQSGQQGYPVLLIVDEAPRIASQFDFERPLSIARGANVSIVLAMQAVSQFEEDKRDAIFGGLGTVITLGGVGHTTAEYVSKRYGERQSQRYGFNDPGMFNSVGASLITETVPVLATREIMQLPFGEHPAIVHVNAAGIPVTRRPIVTDLTDNGMY
jgi:type IV secretory pathway TraG/TraD family ATPase VirD4